MLAKMEIMVKEVQSNLSGSQDPQNNVADRKISFWEFQVGDHVYVRVWAKKGILKWMGCTKLAPIFCVPFQILAWIGPVAYQLALPSHIQVHNVFHISILKKYIYDLKYIINWKEI